MHRCKKGERLPLTRKASSRTPLIKIENRYCYNKLSADTHLSPRTRRFAKEACKGLLFLPLSGRSTSQEINTSCTVQVHTNVHTVQGNENGIQELFGRRQEWPTRNPIAPAPAPIFIAATSALFAHKRSPKVSLLLNNL